MGVPKGIVVLRGSYAVCVKDKLVQWALQVGTSRVSLSPSARLPDAVALPVCVGVCVLF